MRSVLLRRALNVGLIGLVVVLTGRAEELPRQWRISKFFDSTLDTKERLTALREATYAPGHQPDPSYLQHLNGETYKKQTEASRRTDLKEWYLGGVAPMLVVQCLADRIAVPLNAWNLASQRSNTRLVALPNCGHAMIPEQPQAISNSVIAFLNKVGVASKH